MQDLRVTIIQSDIAWENIPENLDHFGKLIGSIGEESDLILLPETFNTGFSINPDLCAEEMNGKSMQFLTAKAAERNSVIMATLLIREGPEVYNRLVCIYPDGSAGFYDKRHLFRLSDEFRLIRKGRSKPVFIVKEWKISPMICYDLRFPVWSKNNWTDGVYTYDMLVNLANWPGSRSNVWKTLLPARAIENQAYVAGVNRIGRDGQGTGHSGDSMAADAKGNLLWIAGANNEEVRTVIFSGDELTSYRESFTVGMDWDHFSIDMNPEA